jgi:hypothetical protein
MTSTITSPARHTSGTSLIRRVTAIIVATAAMFIGFAVASSASSAHADSVAGDAVFSSDIECGGDVLIFTVNSDHDYDSYAKLWVFDPYTQEWITDGSWVEADYYASFNTAEITFEPGYYSVYVSYAQWTDGEWQYSGEYIDSYEQYYTYNDYEISDSCYMGNDLSTI